jgi:hypothetical protein
MACSRVSFAFTAVLVKLSVFFFVMPYRRFGGGSCLHLQGTVVQEGRWFLLITYYALTLNYNTLNTLIFSVREGKIFSVCHRLTAVLALHTVMETAWHSLFLQAVMMADCRIV